MEERKMRPRPRRSRRKVCKFCVEKATGIDYKDIKKLTGFISETGKIMPRRMSGVCAQARPRDGSAALRRGKILRNLHTFIDTRPFSNPASPVQAALFFAPSTASGPPPPFCLPAEQGRLVEPCVEG